MASWARRSLAADTIFMALVICCVDFTLRIRRRMSTRAGIAVSSGGFSGRGSGGRGLEHRGELLEGGLHLVAKAAAEILLLHDLGHEGSVAHLEPSVELLLVASAVGDRVGIEEPIRGREDDDDLLL